MAPLTSQAPGHQTTHERLHLTVNGVPVEIALFQRTGSSTPILFLRGLGSSKEDYVDIRLQETFDGSLFIAYGALGCGETWCEDLSKVNIDFLVKTAEAILRHYNINKIHLVGHSMGGLTALELAHQNPGVICNIINIKGNLVPDSQGG